MVIVPVSHEIKLMMSGPVPQEVKLMIRTRFESLMVKCGMKAFVFITFVSVVQPEKN